MQVARARGVKEEVAKVIASWLEPRAAEVVVHGSKSQEWILSNMVYQGTVWGPSLWNVFFEDARAAINQMMFEEVPYADDLNSFRLYPRSISNHTILHDVSECQQDLHRWGRGNQVVFDASKETVNILSTTEPHGMPFKILGVKFDAKLQMGIAIHECVTQASWRMKTLLRTRRFYNDCEMILFFKAHILSFVEYRTAAVYHVCTSDLRPLDRC